MYDLVLQMFTFNKYTYISFCIFVVGTCLFKVDKNYHSWQKIPNLHTFNKFLTFLTLATPFEPNYYTPEMFIKVKYIF